MVCWQGRRFLVGEEVLILHDLVDGDFLREMRSLHATISVLL